MLGKQVRVVVVATLGLWLAVLMGTAGAEDTVEVGGELRQWHRVTLTFVGPDTSETGEVNPFLDYRLDVTFTHPASGKEYVTPGFYAADGNAANTHAESGNKWQVHFAPDEIGAWEWVASFRQGEEVAVAEDSQAGESAGYFDGASGALTIEPSDKGPEDNRGRGRLKYVGERYLRWAGTGGYFLKQGADAPENLLAYAHFDGEFKRDGISDELIKTYEPHVGDWQMGDPGWDRQGDEQSLGGQGLIGAINYLADEGMNAISFLTLNIEGDDKNVFPYLTYQERRRLDVSRLAQWEIVFAHADTRGMFLHFKTQETENDHLLDGGELGVERRLYYRELVARFGHHLALNWNLGEENTNTNEQQRAFIDYLRTIDPYDHPIVLHTYPEQKEQVYGPLLSEGSGLAGVSLQTDREDFGNVHRDVLEWVRRAQEAGRPWVVAVDEPGDPQHAIRPDDDAGDSHENGRRRALWGTLMAGGAGCEYYFGYGHAHSDLTLQDFRSRDAWWDYARHALAFFRDNDIPFWEMASDDSLTPGEEDYVFAKPGEVYVVYLARVDDDAELDLSAAEGEFAVRWFDPRRGGDLQAGSVEQVSGGGVVELGAPLGENEAGADWVVVVRAE